MLQFSAVWLLHSHFHTMPMTKASTSPEPEQQSPKETPSSIQTQTTAGDIDPEGTAPAANNQVHLITSLLLFTNNHFFSMLHVQSRHTLFCRFLLFHQKEPPMDVPPSSTVTGSSGGAIVCQPSPTAAPQVHLTFNLSSSCASPLPHFPAVFF